MDQNEEQGFQPIGNLARKIAPLPSNADLKQEQLPQSSETTGARSLAPRDASSIGRQHGGTAVATLPSEVETALMGRDAWKTDKVVVACLPPQLRSLLRSKVNAEFDLIGWEFSRQPDRWEIGHALMLVEPSCQPAPAAQALMALTKCFAVTKGKKDDEIDIKVTLAAMVDGLAEFPADVVHDACQSYAKWNIFRPSLAELRNLCWGRFKARDSLRRALLAARDA